MPQDARRDTMTLNPIDRREHTRFRVNPGYTPIQLRVHPEERFEFSGHIYDISEGGVCFELDRPIEPGARVSIQIDLPGHLLESGRDIGPGRAVFATGNVIWCDMDEPGASRMAVAITRFDRAGDRERLIRALTAGRYLRAA
ncbi:MAG: PilZ domain-containing protein [Phycisphaerales bacterium]|nr:PilZ domain-containing protein [Planctomycetota bacterium]MCH8508557.1 PilZ domain-containing protein [Phycisphaerales bacterium]